MLLDRVLNLFGLFVLTKGDLSPIEDHLLDFIVQVVK